MHVKHLLAPSLLASALLLSAGHALAGADLSVTGKIERAGACSLALGNGGTVDLGTISRKDLMEDKPTYFRTRAEHQISLDIHCRAPTKVAFRALDNRAGTSIHIGGLIPGFGMGASGGKNVGRYYLLPQNRIGDGAKLDHLVDRGGGDGWEVTYFDWAVGTSELSSWAKPGQTLPQAFQNISSTLDFTIYIAPAKDLDFSQEIAIDGSATMELIYL